MRPCTIWLHVLLDDALAFIIERAGRLIEYEDARVHDERPRNGDALALPAGEVRAALADMRVVALRQFEDKFMRAREFAPPL